MYNRSKHDHLNYNRIINQIFPNQIENVKDGVSV